MKTVRSIGLIVACSLLIGAAFWHIELTDSRPKADEVLEAAPSEIWLQFSVTPDLEQTGIALLGSSGMVELGEVSRVDSVSITATVVGTMADGEYIVSWRSAPQGDHGSRGRFKFTVGN